MINNENIMKIGSLLKILWPFKDSNIEGLKVNVFPMLKHRKMVPSLNKRLYDLATEILFKVLGTILNDKT